jgi:protein SCO1/2
MTAVLGLVGGEVPHAAAENPAQTLKDVGITPRIGERIPTDLAFRDTEGQSLTLEKCVGERPLVLTPVYYRCPMLCGLELDGLVRCLRAIDLTVGQDFDIVTFSIDPHETADLAAAKHAKYVETYGRASAKSGWRFLTGDAEAVTRLCEAVGFRALYDEATGQYAHAAGILVLTPEGRISRYFYGVEFAPRDLRMALVEASTGKLGTLTDQVLLYCYAYDPTTGKYGMAIMNLVRAAGVMTVLTLAAGIGWMLWRERKLQIAN